MHIVNRVFPHSSLQRPLSPICLLRMFVKLNAEIAFHQRTQAELANAQETRCNRRVEDFVCDKIQAPTQHAQIVVCAMQHNFFRLERPAQWLEIDTGQRIDDEINTLTARHSEPFDFAQDRLRRGIPSHYLGRSSTGSFDFAQDDCVWHTDLKQTKFLAIRMQAVGFCIKRDAIGWFD